MQIDRTEKNTIIFTNDTHLGKNNFFFPLRVEDTAVT